MTPSTATTPGRAAADRGADAGVRWGGSASTRAASAGRRLWFDQNLRRVSEPLSNTASICSRRLPVGDVRTTIAAPIRQYVLEVSFVRKRFRALPRHF